MICLATETGSTSKKVLATEILPGISLQELLTLWCGHSRESYITEEQYADLTFGDWADIIGSAWFSDLIHDMALTNNGRYAGFGNGASDYREDGLKSYLGLSRNSGCDCEPCRFTILDLFDANSLYEEDTDQTFLTASLTADFRGWLRKGMKESKSPGCPVARRAGALSLGLVDNDPHARRLIDRGDMEIISRDEERGRARFVQEYTPIDRALDSFAALLDQYDQAYGTPYVYSASSRVVHRRLPKTSVLTRRGNVPFERGG